MAECAPAGIDLAAGRLADGLAGGPGLTDDDAEGPGGALGEAGCAANSLLAGPPAMGDADCDPGDGSPSADALDWPLDVASERPCDGDGTVLSACADDLLAGDPAGRVGVRCPEREAQQTHGANDQPDNKLSRDPGALAIRANWPPIRSHRGATLSLSRFIFSHRVALNAEN